MTEPLHRLVIIGGGGFGREVLDVVEAVNAVTPTHCVLGFVDAAPAHPEWLADRGASVFSHVGDPSVSGASYLVAIADAAARERMSELADDEGLVPATVWHPSATAGAGNRVGAGLVVCAHVAITTNIELGRHVHLNLNATVGHDCVLGDFVTLNPGANISGAVTLERGVTIGTGAAVIQGVTVGEGTTVGAGAVVTRDLPPQVVAVGSPARPVRSLG